MPALLDAIFHKFANFDINLRGFCQQTDRLYLHLERHYHSRSLFISKQTNLTHFQIFLVMGIKSNPREVFSVLQSKDKGGRDVRFFICEDSNSR